MPPSIKEKGAIAQYKFVLDPVYNIIFPTKMNAIRVVSLLVVFYALYSYYCPQIVVPELEETWWGPGNNESADSTIRPFKISFSDKDVADLKMRLKNTRKLAPALKEAAWTYGMNSDSLKPILDYWMNKYDFKKREIHLNRYPQFITNIQGLDIHFIHAKEKESIIAGKRVLPLLIEHGWPGSIVEFHKILPMLITPRAEHDFVFEVVAPSLPGFGFSTSAIIPGLGSPQMAVVLKNLMLRLGLDKFYTQGGDWGAITTTSIAALFPQHVMGMHSNMCAVVNFKNIVKTIIFSFAPSLFLSEQDHIRMYPLKKRLASLLEETGYLHIQATKPDTVGVGSSDSPAALAAYILEKFSTGTKYINKFKQNGGLNETYTFDELIDNLMMYWIPKTMTTSMRIYAETLSIKTRSLKIDSIPVNVPSACAQFPHEIIHHPESFLNDRFKNLIRVTKMPRGGHFAALEEPELLANDIWNSVAEMERLRQTNNQPRDEAKDL